MNRSGTAILISIVAFSLSGCETMVAPRYSISADNNVAIKSLGVSNIGVGEFMGPSSFDANCRALGPLEVPDRMTHTQYIRKALQDELKVAGVFAETSPRVVLSGTVTRMEFSSTRAVTGGSWTVDVELKSSNGRSLKATEYYEFQSGFMAQTACKQTAEAFAPTVQNLLGKIVRSRDFVLLVK